MRIVTALTASFIVAVSAIAAPGRAQLTSGSGSPPTIYVEDFRPVDEAAQGSGPLGAIASSMHRREVDENADRLSDALVAALNSRNASATRLHDTDAVPERGWIVRGVLYSLDKQSHLISLPFQKSGGGPNVEVSVTIADAARDPATPFAVVGTDAALKGQGSALSWNPYIIGAKFIVKKVEGEASIEALAQQIAAKILDSRQALALHDR